MEEVAQPLYTLSSSDDDLREPTPPPAAKKVKKTAARSVPRKVTADDSTPNKSTLLAIDHEKLDEMYRKGQEAAWSKPPEINFEKALGNFTLFPAPVFEIL